MITSHYVITGLMHGKTRYWLVQRGDAESLYLATGFVTEASRFLERHKAQQVADRENGLNGLSGLPIWRGIRWEVVQVQVELQQQPDRDYKVVVHG